MVKSKEKTAENSQSIYYSFIALAFVAGLFIVDFMPGLRTLEHLESQYLYLTILNLVLGLIIYNNQAVIDNNLITIIKRNSVLKIYVVFLILCAISLITTRNFSLSVISLIRLILIFCLVLNLIILLYNRLHLFDKIILVVIISTFLQSVIEIFNLINITNLSTLTNGLSALKGNTGNINIFSASLSIRIPFILFGIISSSNKKKWFSFFTLFLAISLIFLTRSRTAFISSIVEIILFSIGCLYYTKKGNLKTLLVIYGLFIVSFIGTKLIIDSTDDYRKSALTRLTNITEDASANLRTSLWGNALKISSDYPFTGVGLGNWKVELLGYEKLIFSGTTVSTHAHNDFLEIIAETGFLNGFIFISLFVVVFWINVKRLIKPENDTSQAIAFLVLLAFTSLTIDSLFNFPLYRPTMQILFCICIALTVVNTDKKEDNTADHKTSIKISLLGFFVLAITCCYFSFLSFKASQLENRIVFDETLTARDILTELPKYPNIGVQSTPFIEYAGIKYFTYLDYKKATDCFKKSEKLNPYSNSQYYRAAMLKDSGKIDSAYYYIKKSFFNRPRYDEYFKAILEIAKLKKDTLNILKIHTKYNKYSSAPENWMITSSALYSATYNKSKLISFLDKGLKEFPNNQTIIVQKLFFEAQIYTEKNLFDKGLEIYQKVLKIDPNNMVCLQNIGVCHFYLNQFDTALKYFEKTLNSPESIKNKSLWFIEKCKLNMRLIGSKK